MDARHPFIKTVGISILIRGNAETQTKLLEVLALKLNSLPPDDSLEVLFEYNNTFILLIAERGKVVDFEKVIRTLKSCNNLIAMLIFRDLRVLRANHHWINYLDLRTLLNLRIVPGWRDWLYWLDLRDWETIYYFRNYLNLKSLRQLHSEYKQKYKLNLQQHASEILNWTDRTLQQLQHFSDEEVFKYFPGTTEAELREFRAKKTN